MFSLFVVTILNFGEDNGYILPVKHDVRFPPSPCSWLLTQRSQ